MDLVNYESFSFCREVDLNGDGWISVEEIFKIFQVIGEREKNVENN